MRPNANWSILVQICPERTNHPQINSAGLPVNYLSTYLRLKSVLQYWSPLDDVLPSLCHAQLRLLLLLLRRRLVWADARSRVDQLLAPVVVVVVLVGVDFEGRVCFSIFALKFIWKEFIPRICRRLLLCFLPILASAVSRYFNCYYYLFVSAFFNRKRNSETQKVISEKMFCTEIDNSNFRHSVQNSRLLSSPSHTKIANFSNL